MGTRPGQEAEAAQLRFEVDRQAGRAAHALAAAGSYVEWKPRGTFQTQPVNPAVAWSTILAPDPMFGPDVILACCSQALGILDMQAEAAEEDESKPLHRVRAGLPDVPGGWVRRHAWPAVRWVGGVTATVIAGFLIYVLGWS